MRTGRPDNCTNFAKDSKLPADVPKRAYVEPIGVGEVLPSMPAYLDADSYVPVPLEATYQTTWARCPEVFREAVEGGLRAEG